MTLTIVTNNHERELIYQWELSESERQEFDWIDFDKDVGYLFFRYRGNIYCLADFMRIEYHPDESFSSWHGYMNETFFSGIVVKYTDDTEGIIVGHYYS